MLYRIGCALGALLVLTWAVPEARAGKVGAEFRVNTTTANDQGASSVAALSGGGFVVTWTSETQDGSGDGVYGQLYNAAGAPVGSEFLVNTTTANDQRISSVAALTGGGFVVTWNAYGQDGAPSSLGVYGQRYSAAGVRVGTEFSINTRTANDQAVPSVAGLSNGGFVVIWSSYAQDTSSSWGVYGQRYNAAGARVGNEFKVNRTTASDQRYPTVAALGDGGFVVAWQSYGQDSPGNYGVYAQRFTATGARAGGEFLVNTVTASDQSAPSVAPLSGGGFVVTWSSIGQDGSPSSWGVYGQRYDAAGVRVGSPFRVNTWTAGDQRSSSVAGLGDGGFVVAWHSYGQNDSGYGVYGQRYSAAGVRVGKEFRINTYTGFWQLSPSVAGLSNGGFIVTWDSGYFLSVAATQDGSGYGVYGQRYSP